MKLIKDLILFAFALLVVAVVLAWLFVPREMM